MCGIINECLKAHNFIPHEHLSLKIPNVEIENMSPYHGQRYVVRICYAVAQVVTG